MAFYLAKRILRKIVRTLNAPVPNPGFSSSDPFYYGFYSKLPAFKEKLAAIKAGVKFNSSDLFWHPYDILSNFSEINILLTGINRSLFPLFGNMPVADIGAADGDLSFFLEYCGVKNIHILEYASTNCNRLEGARALKKALSSSVELHEINIDSRDALPFQSWGVVFLLGTLYHLKNPFFILERLARCSRYCFLSTRITRFAPDKKTDLSKIPVAYLLDENELNNDVTNFWVFSDAGLRRIVHRTGWDILDYSLFGSYRSTPASMDNTQRAFCLLKSRVGKG
jgi:tRNA (mo5U34)-methyltransferase